MHPFRKEAFVFTALKTWAEVLFPKATAESSLLNLLCMYLCKCTHAQTHNIKTHIQTHIHVNALLHKHADIHIYTCTQAYTHANVPVVYMRMHTACKLTYRHRHTCAHKHTSACVLLYTCMQGMYVHMCTILLLRVPLTFCMQIRLGGRGPVILWTVIQLS